MELSIWAVWTNGVGIVVYIMGFFIIKLCGQVKPWCYLEKFQIMDDGLVEIPSKFL